MLITRLNNFSSMCYKLVASLTMMALFQQSHQSMTSYKYMIWHIHKIVLRTGASLVNYIIGPAHEMFVHLYLTQMHKSGAIGLNVCRSLHLHPYFAFVYQQKALAKLRICTGSPEP